MFHALAAFLETKGELSDSLQGDALIQGAGYPFAAFVV